MTRLAIPNIGGKGGPAWANVEKQSSPGERGLGCCCWIWGGTSFPLMWVRPRPRCLMSQAVKDRSPYRGLLPARTAARAAAAAAAGASGRVLQLVAVRAVHWAVA